MLVGKILFLGDIDNRGGPEVYMMAPDGSGVARLSSREFYDRATARDAYSSDRRFYAFVRRENTEPQERQIFASDAFYSSERQLTHFGGGTTTWDPAWSPTAEVVAFVSNASDNDEIWVMDRSSNDPTQITFNDWAWDKFPTWSPDGNQIVFMSNRTGGQQLWIMAKDGSNQRQITNFDFDVWDPVWVKYTDQ